MRKRDLLLHPTTTTDLNVGHDIGWFIADEDAADGYTWCFTGDDSGLYELVDNFTVYPPAISRHAGKHIFKIKGIKSGDAAAHFDLVRGGENPRESVTVTLHVV